MATPPDAEPGAPTTLYRRYRPSRFGEVVGQGHVTTALRNAVREGRIGHAYLFSGPRGTGKTTTARLLAKTLNCLELADDAEPCGKCENCLAIAAGEFYDLIELDAASNRGVDAMRNLIQSVSLGLGASSRRKVYVVDEVHMLTADASNSLLKTLEEPPSHVVFVLATTEPGKVLPTIRSRTQHFEFSLFDHDELVGLLTDVLDREGVEADAQAVDLVAKRAGGSARDALSLLDQALALGGGALDAETVRRSFGGTEIAVRVAVLDAIVEEDIAGALRAVSDQLTAGVDPRRLVDDLLRTARDAFVLGASRHAVPPREVAAGDIELLGGLAERAGLALLTRMIDLLGESVVDIRGPAAPDPRLVLEVTVARLARRDAASGIDALVDRLDRLERKVAELEARPAGPPADPHPARPGERGAATSEAEKHPAPEPAASAVGSKPALGAVARSEPVSTGPAPPSPASERASQPATERSVEPAAEEPTTTGDPHAGELTLDDVIQAWPSVLGALSTPVRSQVDVAQPVAVEGDVVVFGAPSVHVKRINTKFRENAEAIKAALRGSLGQSPKLKIVEHNTFVDPPPVATSPERAEEPPLEDPPPDDDVDLGSLVDDPGAGTRADSASRLLDAFDATIVDEKRH